MKQDTKELAEGLEIEKVEDKEEGVTELKMNDIAEITIHTANPLVFDKYTENKVTGSLIFIDPDTNETVGAGLIK